MYDKQVQSHFFIGPKENSPYQKYYEPKQGKQKTLKQSYVDKITP